MYGYDFGSDYDPGYDFNLGQEDHCLFCGLAATGPPAMFSAMTVAGAQCATFEQLAETMAEEILDVDDSIMLGKEEIVQRVRDALQNIYRKNAPGISAHNFSAGWQWLSADGPPRGSSATSCVAIGYFRVDEENIGERPHIDNQFAEVPSGEDVTIRRVCNYDPSSRAFYLVLKDKTLLDSVVDSGSECEGERSDSDSENWSRLVVVVDREAETRCSGSTGDEWCPAGFYNIFLHFTCWIYLQHWLSPQLPPRLAFRRPMSLAGELFEIVNAKFERGKYGLQEGVDYGVIGKALGGGSGYYLSSMRTGSYHTASALAAGVSEADDLIPFVRCDFNWWYFTRPDIWPKRPEELVDVSSWRTFSSNIQLTSARLLRLPAELHVTIAEFLPLHSVIAFASTCKTISNSICTDDRCTRRVLLRTDFFTWIRPVGTTNDMLKAIYKMRCHWRTELQDAAKALATWLPESSTADRLDATAMLRSRDFPIGAFFQACLNSNSIRNRKRLWGMAKQFDELWWRYRVHGWDFDVFSPGSRDFQALREHALRKEIEKDPRDFWGLY